MSFNNNTSQNSPLVRNNRFECLNEDYNTERRRQPMSSSRYHSNNSRNRDRNRDHYNMSNTNSMFRGRFSFLTEKKELKKKNQTDLKKERFPSLIDIRAIKKTTVKNDDMKENDKKNYKEVATYTEEELLQIQKEKEKEKNKVNMQGWVTISKKNGKTVIHNLDKDGKKDSLCVESEEVVEDEYDHDEYQYKCAVAMYKTLQQVQEKRNENIETFGCMSPYYGKGDLTDLSYLSDSDVESSDSNNDESDNQDCDSDADTY